MKHRLTQTFPLLLAAALQLLPLMRNLVTSPMTGSSFAFILRWGIGPAAALEAVNAVSGASTWPTFISPTNFNLTAGSYFSNSVVVSLVAIGGQVLTTDGFLITNLLNTTQHAAYFANGQSTTNGLPPGLKCTCISINNSSYIYASLVGTNNLPGTYKVSFTCYSVNQNAAITTNVFFNVASAISAPVITNQPISVTNNVGSSASFTLTAGAAPLIYQWYFNTNSALLNQTNATLTLNNIQLTNSGYYLCNITNSAGSTNSANAFLTVWQPPVITNHPTAFTTVAGGSATFSITAGGTPAPIFQWKFNTNTVLSGATGTTLSLANLRASQAGTYSVTVTNAAGVTNSFMAALTVTNPPPPVLANAVNVSGGKFNFTFTPVPGLTNTVLTNGALDGGNWGVFTNLPPPASATPVSLGSPAGSGNLFYKLMVQP